MRFLIFISSVFLFACSADHKNVRSEQSFGGEAQGTSYTVKYIGLEQAKLPTAVDSLLNAIDASMSTYVESSTISKLNNGDSAIIEPIFMEVFLLSKKINSETDGAFDPTLAPIIEAWGFDFAEAKSMDTNKINELMKLCGFEQFKLEGNVLHKKTQEAKLNFNAIAQGYSVDLIGQLLKDRGIKDYYVELGGEVIVSGLNRDSVAWRIGIDKPEGQNLERKLSAIVNLKDQAMVTSGNYRKFVEVDGKKYSHSINPISGFPTADSLLSATIICTEAAVADAMATACMVKGYEGCKSFVSNRKDLGAILIYANAKGELQTFISENVKSQVEDSN